MFKKIPLTIEELSKIKKEIKPIYVNDDSVFKKPIKLMGVGNYEYIDYLTGERKNTSHKLFTLGNFSVIKGASKTQKTFLQNLFVASFLNPNINNHNNILRINENINKKVIIFDTEQHVSDVMQNRLRINAMTKKINNNLVICSLRELNYLEKIEIINNEIKKNEYSLVVIDGIKDLVRDLNDYVEGFELTEKLLNLSSVYNCHIITIIHTNTGTTKARGHIGSTLYEKCETMLNIEADKNSNIKKINCEMIRGSKAFDDIYFEVNKLDGLPYFIDSQNEGFI